MCIALCILPSFVVADVMFGRQDITQSLQSVAYVSMALERHADEEHVNKIEQIQCMG